MTGFLWVLAAVAAALAALGVYRPGYAPRKGPDSAAALQVEGPEPSLLNARHFAVEDIGSFRWDPTNSSDLLVVSRSRPRPSCAPSSSLAVSCHADLSSLETWESEALYRDRGEGD